MRRWHVRCVQAVLGSSSFCAPTSLVMHQALAGRRMLQAFAAVAPSPIAYWMLVRLTMMS